MTVPIPGHLCLPPATSADPPFPLPPRDERGVPAATLPILSGAPGFRRARGGARGGGEEKATLYFSQADSWAGDSRMVKMSVMMGFNMGQP